jgi:hypothetical protein
LLFRTLAGFHAELLAAGDGTMLPYEIRTQSPVLVSQIDQIDNTASLMGTLGRLLYEGRAAAINQDQAP